MEPITDEVTDLNVKETPHSEKEYIPTAEDIAAVETVKKADTRTVCLGLSVSFATALAVHLEDGEFDSIAGEINGQIKAFGPVKS